MLIELLLIAGLGWLIVNVFARARANERSRLEQPRRPPIEPGPPVERSVTEELGANERTSRGAPASPAPPTAPTPRTRDEQIAELRRRYVADEITVEEYEAELDRLLQK